MSFYLNMPVQRKSWVWQFSDRKIEITPRQSEAWQFLLEGWGHVALSWLGVYIQVHQLMCIRVQGTLRSTGETIYLLSLFVTKLLQKTEEWMIFSHYKLTSGFFKLQNPWASGSVSVNWNLTNYITELSEENWQDLDSLAFSQTILGYGWGEHYQKSGAICNKMSVCTLYFGQQKKLIAWIQQFSWQLVAVPMNVPRYI